MPRSAAKRVDFGAGWSVTHQVTALPLDKNKLPELLATGVFQKQTGLKRPDDSRAQEALRSLVDSPRRRAAVIINGATRSETLSTSARTYFVLHLDWEELLTYLRTIAEVLQVSETTVTTTLCRATRNLRHALAVPGEARDQQRIVSSGPWPAGEGP